MKTLNIERFEEHTLILERNVDYLQNDLKPDAIVGNKLFGLPAEKLTEIARANGYDKWTWTGREGYLDELEDLKLGIKVKFAKFI